METDQPDGYSIQQLAEKAGVSVRTIRFYISEGLLAMPPNRGRYTVYDDEYVDRLELIRRMKDAFLPLKEIRDRMTALSWAEVKQALAEPTPTPRASREPPRGGEDALNYISKLMGPPPNPMRISESRPQARATAPESWERLSLAPGVELHIREDASPLHRRLVRQLIDYAKKIFNTA